MREARREGRRPRPMSDTTGSSDYIGLTANIVSAFVSHNSVQAGEIPGLIAQVHTALLQISAGVRPRETEPLRPLVPVKRSVTADYIICLEDGKKFKSLKRHLRSQYNLSPEQYREKWGL